MGSATTQALGASTAALSAAQGVDLGTARELFAAARAVGESSQLGGALADPAANPAARTALAGAVFAGLSETSRALLQTVVSQRWSSASDLVDGIEELAVRAAAVASPSVDVEGEIFSVSRAIAANPELELALGGRLGDAARKGALVEKVLGGTASEVTTLIVSSLVQQGRGRRVRQLLGSAMRVVAEQRGRTVATVVTATALTSEQESRLAALLSGKYGRDVSLNTVVDPKVVGGLRVQVADDVIDASIASRLADLRHRLAG